MFNQWDLDISLEGMEKLKQKEKHVLFNLQPFASISKRLAKY